MQQRCVTKSTSAKKKKKKRKENAPSSPAKLT